MHSGYSIEDTQVFVMNMTFISSSEVKKYIFHEWRSLTSRDEIKVIFIIKFEFSLYYLQRIKFSA